MGRYTDMLRKRLRNALPSSTVSTIKTGVEVRITKGQKDGHCNRTACQAPLRGRKQWRMKNYMVKDTFHHYCHPCAMLFNGYDRSIGEPLRCEEVPDRIKDEPDIILAGEPE